MSSYVQKVLADVKAKNANEPEFIQAVEEVLRRCLAEAARDTYNLEVGHSTQNPARIVVVPARDGRLEGFVYTVGEYRPVVHSQEHGNRKRILHSVDVYQRDDGCRKQHTCEYQAFHTHSICQAHLIFNGELRDGDNRHPQTKENQCRDVCREGEA